MKAVVAEGSCGCAATSVMHYTMSRVGAQGSCGYGAILLVPNTVSLVFYDALF